MADPVKEVAKAPMKAWNFVKGNWVAFAFLFLILFVVFIRWGADIARGLGRVPLLGKGINWLATVGRRSSSTTTALIPVAVGLAILLGSGDAFAGVTRGGGAGAGTSSAAYLLGVLALGFGVALAGFPGEKTMDLKTDGGDTTQSITPGTSEVQKVFKITAPRGSTDGAYIRTTTLDIALRTGIDQPGAGGSVINWDMLPKAVGGVEIQGPVFGTELTKESGYGPLLKHIQEFVCGGMEYSDGARAQIAAADGDTEVEVYIAYHFAPKNVVRTHDYARWIGWQDQTTITFWHAITTALDGDSTGAVLENSAAGTQVRMSLGYFLDNDLDLPVMIHSKKHTHTAGSNTIRVLNLGSNESLEGTRGYARHLGIFECFDVMGMGGPDGADNITQVHCPQLGIDRVTNVDALVKTMLRAWGYRRGPKGGVGASTPLHDLAGNPYTMAAAPNARLNASTLMFLALLCPSVGQELTKTWKFAGDLEITQQYTTTPSSGNHVIYVISSREFDNAKREELRLRAKLPRQAWDKVPLADGSSVGDVIRNGKRPQSLVGLPRALVMR